MVLYQPRTWATASRVSQVVGRVAKYASRNAGLRSGSLWVTRSTKRTASQAAGAKQAFSQSMIALTLPLAKKRQLSWKSP